MRFLLFPFSLLYGIVTFVRNRLYDWGWMRSVQYEDICVISVGNITVGGTGKTPHVEYLLRLLSPEYNVAVLSRGYKRKTKGFVLAETTSTAAEIGDEPYQIKQKFPGIVVAVDADRVGGIGKMREACPGIQVVLLDDAFQYRRIKPALSILLADYNRPMYRDGMLPGGRLREWTCFAKRAGIMIVTKSPENISTEEQQSIKQRYIRVFPGELFFSTIVYGDLQPVFRNGNPLPVVGLESYDILLVAGIANPKPFEAHIRRHAASVQTVIFPDHHAFSDKDVENIVSRWHKIDSNNKLIVTTEKDAVRLQQAEIPEAVAPLVYYIPIVVDFADGKKNNFEQKIKDILPATGEV